MWQNTGKKMEANVKNKKNFRSLAVIKNVFTTFAPDFAKTRRMRVIFFLLWASPVRPAPSESSRTGT